MTSVPKPTRYWACFVYFSIWDARTLPPTCLQHSSSVNPRARVNRVDTEPWRQHESGSHTREGKKIISSNRTKSCQKMQSLADCRHYQHNKFVNRLVSFDVPNHLHLYSKVLSNFIDVHSGLNLSVVSCRRTNVGVRSSLFQSVMVASSMPYI